jgi:hypothetical protein
MEPMKSGTFLNLVMPGLGPGIHVFAPNTQERKTWMAGTSPAMTKRFIFPSERDTST